VSIIRSRSITWSPEQTAFSEHIHVVFLRVKMSVATFASSRAKKVTRVKMSTRDDSSSDSEGERKKGRGRGGGKLSKANDIQGRRSRHLCPDDVERRSICSTIRNFSVATSTAGSVTFVGSRSTSVAARASAPSSSPTTPSAAAADSKTRDDETVRPGVKEVPGNEVVETFPNVAASSFMPKNLAALSPDKTGPDPVDSALTTPKRTVGNPVVLSTPSGGSAEDKSPQPIVQEPNKTGGSDSGGKGGETVGAAARPSGSGGGEDQTAPTAAAAAAAAVSALNCSDTCLHKPENCQAEKRLLVSRLDDLSERYERVTQSNRDLRRLFNLTKSSPDILMPAAATAVGGSSRDAAAAADWTAKLDESQARVKELEMKLRQAKNEIAGKGVKFDNLRRELEFKDESMSKKDARVKDLEKELKTVKNERSVMQQTKDKQMNQRLQEKNSQIKELKAKLEGQDPRAKELEKEVEKVKEEKSALESRMAKQAHVLLTEKNTQIDDLESRLETELKSKDSRMEDLEKKVKRVEGEKFALDSSLKKTHQLLTEKNNQIKELKEEQKKALENKDFGLKELEKKLESVKADKSAWESSMAKRMLDEKESLIQELKDKLRVELQYKEEKMTDKLEGYLEDLEIAQSKAKKTESKVKKLKADLESVTKEISTLK